MKLLVAAILILCCYCVFADEHKGSHKPYEKELSDHDHHDEDGEEHDARYDHDAFLGKEEASEFDKLSPEESIERLGRIVDKIDVNGDKKVTQEELKDWIRKVSQKSTTEDARRQFDALKPKDEKVYWETFALQNYGKPEERPTDENDQMKQNLLRDERKWKKADQDGDGALSLKEFTAFIHPEEAPHMREIVIEEAMSDIDKNKDGYISVDEYLQDLYHDYLNDTVNKKKLPEWVENERKEFQTKLDKDKDGKLSPTEVYRWIVPEDYDHSIKETRHLIEKADSDKDGVLTKEEILKNHETFVGSQATDYGNVLNRHEEL